MSASYPLLFFSFIIWKKKVRKNIYIYIHIEERKKEINSDIRLRAYNSTKETSLD